MHQIEMIKPLLFGRKTLYRAKLQLKQERLYITHRNLSPLLNLWMGKDLEGATFYCNKGIQVFSYRST
jgi:hypothetical protein